MRNQNLKCRFKRFFIVGLLIGASNLFGQTPTENYIYVQEPLVPVQVVTESTEAIRSVQYFDGLGRPKQNIAIQATPDGKDIVTKIEYDGFGRQEKDYLPIPTSQSNGAFIDPSNINGNYYYTNFGENTWFSEKTFENSPLNRVLAQAAPGNDWKKGSGHEIEFEYQTNTANEVWIYWVDGNDLIKKGDYGGVGNYYPKNSLYKTITTDENGNKIEEFKDKQGRIVLKRSEVGEYLTALYGNPTPTVKKVNTYYIYDIYNNLIAVVPPLAAEKISLTDDQVKALCYLYRYDDRNRLVEKKLPGKGWEYMVYDKQDRLVATQDANLRLESKWLFTKYDKFGRVVYTGLYEDNRNRALLQTHVYSFNANNETRSSSFSQHNLPVYYTKNAFPKNFEEIYTVNYYDTYDGGMSSTILNEFGQAPLSEANARLKGLAVSSYVRILNSNTWEKNYTVYDHKSRAYGSYKINSLNGFTKTESILNFTGLPTTTTSKHKRISTGTEVVIKEDFTYDSMLRVKRHTHSVNDGIPQIIANNSYDALGQLVNQEVGGNTTEIARWQSVDYKYNIRGWLTDINNVDLPILGENQIPPKPYDDLFSFKIMYNKIFAGTGNGAQKLYNGNIAQTFWKTGSDNKFRGYDYTYDQLNRLLNADFYKSGMNPYTGAYKESLSYDLNGNITNLIRTTGDANGNAIGMDDLTYAYESGNGNSNLLKNVSDAVSNQNTGGFVDGNTNPSLDDYEYDGNGNMILDRNKGITEIKYNYLNLPTKISFSNNKYIAYQYNAIGQKIRKTIEYTDSLKIVDYLDGFQYTGSVLQFFPTSEGYVKATPLTRTNTSFAFNYIYNYTDHLGNVRISYTKDPKTNALKIVDESHYYPFGLKHGVYVPNSLKDFKSKDTTAGGGIGDPVKLVNVLKTEYQYKYNGFEYQDELNLNWYDYKTRNYDPALGRWMNIDPLAETSRKFSPYAYALDNPVFFIDPDGMKAEASSDSSSSDQNKVSSGIAGIKFNLNNHEGAISYVNYSESFSTTQTNTYKLAIGEDNPQSLKDLSNDVIVSDNTRDYLSGESQRLITSTITTHYKGGEETLGLMINSFHQTGRSIRDNAGKTKYGNNNFYFENRNTGRVFQGNQYVKVNSLSKIGNNLAKRAGALGSLYTASTIVTISINEGGFGHESQKATAGVVGGMAGAWGGAKAGAWAGGAIGSAFGGVGAIPGAIIGGAIGSVVGSVIGTELSESRYESFSQ